MKVTFILTDCLEESVITGMDFMHAEGSAKKKKRENLKTRLSQVFSKANDTRM